MICFFDTSALAKLFMEEQGTAFVEKMVNDEDNEVWVLDFSRVRTIKQYISQISQQRDL